MLDLLEMRQLNVIVALILFKKSGPLPLTLFLLTPQRKQVGEGVL
ncbi:hypothetical protein ABID21_003078 [Pseudorhizobium tarimense]|uniref:Uncharacterized protein n=1 Tax=Pseudorhizobium tarimense TaxID=1079109 RepID=A0ABV2H8S3_9HYPH